MEVNKIDHNELIKWLKDEAMYEGWKNDPDQNSIDNFNAAAAEIQSLIFKTDQLKAKTDLLKAQLKKTEQDLAKFTKRQFETRVW